jgi:hypothetical protein
MFNFDIINYNVADLAFKGAVIDLDLNEKESGIVNIPRTQINLT